MPEQLRQSGSEHSATERGDLLSLASGRSEIVGLVLVSSLIVWHLVSAAAVGGDAKPAAALFVSGTAAFLAARLVARFSDWIFPGLITAGAAGLAWIEWDILLRRPLGNPLGYSNAIGSFYMLAAAAALIVAVRVPNSAAKLLFTIFALGFASVPWLNGTTTAAMLVLLLPLGLLAGNAALARRIIATGAVLMLLIFAATIGLGITYDPAGERAGLIDRTVDSALSERRPRLWSEALMLLAENPVVGIGPGRFAVESPTAILHPVDTRWAHHELLQLGAETGIIGLILGLALFAWAFALLWWRASGRGAAIAGLALTAAGVHSNVDYVFHFPLVAMTAAGLVAAGLVVRAETPSSVNSNASQTPPSVNG
ncbi:hypothetical protein BH23GEM6_BH23GEM6_18240 [soil metagenome]